MERSKTVHALHLFTQNHQKPLPLSSSSSSSYTTVPFLALQQGGMMVPR